MILSLHNLAETYKMLPSQVMREATTFDLYVLDVHSRWVKYQENKQKAISEGKSLPVNNHGLSVEQMKSMVADAKKRKGVKKGA